MVSYSVEPAKSARSTCKGCKLTIGVDVLRFGSHREVQTSNGEHTQAFWSHPGCVTLKVFENAIEAHGSLEGIPGVTEHNALDELEKDYAKSKTVRAKEAFPASFKSHDFSIFFFAMPNF
jgi:hypothetical protein